MSQSKEAAGKTKTDNEIYFHNSQGLGREKSVRQEGLFVVGEESRRE